MTHCAWQKRVTFVIAGQSSAHTKEHRQTVSLKHACTLWQVLEIAICQW